jgi:hypothetical protein
MRLTQDETVQVSSQLGTVAGWLAPRISIGDLEPRALDIWLVSAY